MPIEDGDQDSLADTASGPERPLRILLVAPPFAPPPRWADGNPRVLALPASTLELALERVGAERPDAVAVHPRLIEDRAGLAALDGALDGSPLMVSGSAPAGLPEDALDGSLPTATPPTTVAALVAAAAELRKTRHQLAAATRERDEHQARFEALVQGNADGIMVVDDEGVVRFANPMAARLFGREVETLLGTSFGHPMVAGETTELDALAPRQVPLVVEMRIVNVEWDGGPAHIACLRDVTDRKRAEESARRLIRADAERSVAEDASRRFRFLAEAGASLAASMNDRATLSTLAQLCLREIADWAVVYVVEEDGSLTRLEVVHCEPARAPAATRLREKPLDPRDCEPILAVLHSGEPRLAARVTPDQALQDPETRALVEELGLASYMLLPLSARSRQIGVLALVRSDPARAFDEADLTFASSLATRAALSVDNARLYQTARAADQAKSDLIAVISHDLRTPLNSIIGYTDLIDMGVTGPVSESALDWIRRIRRSAEHQVHLIDQLLSFSRLDAGVEVRASEVDVGTLLGDVQAIMEPLAAKAELTFDVSAEPGLVVVTDADSLRQVLVNLVSNALKYSEKGGIHVTAEKRGDDVVFAVSDTGVGIAPEHRQRIFDPFWQVDPERRRGGTGLGLSIVRRLVRLLGGEIGVTSEPGQGSTFTVRLPSQSPSSA